MCKHSDIILLINKICFHSRTIPNAYRRKKFVTFINSITKRKKLLTHTVNGIIRNIK